MNERKNNGRGIFYGVIGVATLVVAIIGATFAYFTAVATNNDAITGNMVAINFGLDVTKVTTADEEKGGMIPLSNNMIEAAVNDGTGNAAQACVDDNGNAVCQIYKIVVSNNGSASAFLDGYVSLSGGSGEPTDYPADYTATTKTTMRWAQVFCTTETPVEGGAEGAVNVSGCTTAGNNITGTAMEAIGNPTDTTGFNHDNIKTAFADVTGQGTIIGSSYDVINKNYIRLSDHVVDNTSFDRNTDITSALVFNQNLAAKNDASTDDEATYYIVVWLSETGTNQTAGVTVGGENGTTNPEAENFFKGIVNFSSSQGSAVTATFSNYTAVPSDQRSGD